MEACPEKIRQTTQVASKSVAAREENTMAKRTNVWRVQLLERKNGQKC
jgi:predicted GIY-YIG superfamily endonuclease